jgi:hypothetical protein
MAHQLHGHKVSMTRIFVLAFIQSRAEQQIVQQRQANEQAEGFPVFIHRRHLQRWGQSDKRTMRAFESRLWIHPLRHEMGAEGDCADQGREASPLGMIR